ncbi:glucosaminidase domain-containing protein [Paraflavitalea sp. CAU 1676]|uniref:glucosaminidase domain-containing protein n=1 Tax=Paraflavitalea sp. CAU 1676 TaxID=3032598 RepID=UPI0023DA84AC|nr:glucosaminidase domain-containing protein [Paraflavitalea sp. CAU 1676]MDF2188954.1 glucosaminidase domain-containing protein [Paraflavitalea sp. CAU 1676]
MNEIQVKIYSASQERLLRKFSAEQSELLARFMVAQAAHETGNFTSDAFKRNNNTAGYKPFPSSIWQVYPSPAGANKTYAYFSSIENSCYEVADWLGRRETAFSKVKTVADFAAALRSNNYYTDTVGNYTSGLSFYFSSLFKEAGAGVGALFSGQDKKIDLLPILATTIITFVASYFLRQLFKKRK